MAGSRVDVKVVLLGKAYAGKTSVVDRFIHNRFSTIVLSNVGAAFGAKRIDVDNKHVVLGIWDTAGSERFEAMSRIYFRGAKAAILCFDLTDKSSFDRVHFWIEELRTHEEGCKIYLCGTKKDLVVEDPNLRRVNKRAAKALADDCMAEIYETSSKTGENIKELFTQIASDYLESSTPPSSSQNTPKLRDVQKSPCVCKGS